MNFNRAWPALASRLSGTAMRCSYLVLYALLFIPSGGVQAADQAATPLTILAMMKAESDYLAKWQAQQRKKVAQHRPAPALLSIYGVLPQLRATVLVNGHEVVFAQGQKRPVAAHASHTKAFRLRYIKPPCVSFVHHSRRRTLCLPKVGS